MLIFLIYKKSHGKKMVRQIVVLLVMLVQPMMPLITHLKALQKLPVVGGDLLEQQVLKMVGQSVIAYCI